MRGRDGSTGSWTLIPPEAGTRLTSAAPTVPLPSYLTIATRAAVSSLHFLTNHRCRWEGHRGN